MVGRRTSLRVARACARRKAACLRKSAALGSVVAFTLLLVASAAEATSLYDGSGPRPGPQVLYEPLAKAPQLQNARGSVWRAQPILISGTEAYRKGEYLYQGFLYDEMRWLLGVPER